MITSHHNSIILYIRLKCKRYIDSDKPVVYRLRDLSTKWIERWHSTYVQRFSQWWTNKSFRILIYTTGQQLVIEFQSIWWHMVANDRITILWFVFVAGSWIIYIISYEWYLLLLNHLNCWIWIMRVVIMIAIRLYTCE